MLDLTKLIGCRLLEVFLLLHSGPLRHTLNDILFIDVLHIGTKSHQMINPVMLIGIICGNCYTFL